MAFTENSKLYAVKVVNGQKLLFEASKDEVRKATHVDSLPSPSGNKRGLIYLYDDGSGEKGYICVKSGEEYEWLPLGGDDGTLMSKEIYDSNGVVETKGGIQNYVSYEIESYKTTTIDLDSTDNQFPTAKAVYDGLEAVYDGLEGKEDKANKVTSISQSSTNDNYPSAKAVYDGLEGKEDKANKVTSISQGSTNNNYPSAKAVYDFVTNQKTTISMGTISLGTTWTGNDPYTQRVTVTGATVTSKSKVDIQPDSAAMIQLGLDGITALWIENNNGTLTANVIGGPTVLSLTIQCTVMEVE